MFNRVATTANDAVDIEYTEDGIIARTAGEVRVAGGLSRINQWLNSTKGFLTITPFRGSRSLAQNMALFKQLPAELRKAAGRNDIGGYWMVGHWSECSEALPDLEAGENMAVACSRVGGKIVDAVEQSWFFLQPDDMDNGEWGKIAQRIAKKYEQDAYILRRNGEKDCQLIGSAGSGTVWKSMSTNDSVYGTMSVVTRLRNDPESAKEGGFGYSEFKKFVDRGRTNPIVYKTAMASDSEDEDLIAAAHVASGVQFYVAKADSIGTRQLFNRLGALRG